jgi:alkaline phosphatase D
MPDGIAPPAHGRRTVLRAGGLLAVGAAGSFLGGVGCGASRPAFTSGVQAGDVTSSTAAVWARADRPALMVVDAASDDGFRDARPAGVTRLTPGTDYTGTIVLHDLPPGEELFYRVRLAAADDESSVGETMIGRFRTAPREPRDVSFLWSGDICGQGWGINPDIGGMTIFEEMRRLRPDFAICSGDAIYADGPLVERPPEHPTWRNIVTPEKQKVAETLDEFRGNYRYNLLDANLAAFNREVPWIYQWDDHETVNNWYAGKILADGRYTEKRVDVLAGYARRAFLEYTPFGPSGLDLAGRIYRKISYGPLLDVFVLDMRTYRNPNKVSQRHPAGAVILGHEQVDWLLDGLALSSATWKVIAADMPIGLLVCDGVDGVEAVAQGAHGPALGREVEIARLLSGLRARSVRNVVWLTADVHYTAAHHYHPDRAAFTDFDPFWEFVSGPLNAGTFGPNTLDPTFGAEAVFVKARDDRADPRRCTNLPSSRGLPPDKGMQFFGRVHINGASRELTVELRDSTSTVLWSTQLPASSDNP